MDIDDYLRKQALAPQWQDVSRVHDWRNYINIKQMWDTFTDEQKFALAEQAEEQASRELWD